jgi:hypothetical protein
MGPDGMFDRKKAKVTPGRMMVWRPVRAGRDGMGAATNTAGCVDRIQQRPREHHECVRGDDGIADVN